MRKSKKFRIVLLIIIIISLLQLFRMNYFVNWNNLSEKNNNLYHLGDAHTLTTEELKGFSKEKYLYIKFNEQAVNDAYIQLFNYLKMDVEIIDYDGLSLKENIYKYKTIIVGYTRWRDIENFDSIMAYAESGGRLILALDSETFEDSLYNDYAKKLGILKLGKRKDVVGFEFYSPLINGINKVEEKELDNSLFLTTIPVQLSGDKRIHMVDDQENPMIWDMSYGKGQIGFFNCFPAQMEFRKAILLGLMEELDMTFAYPILNAQVVFIDDFPAMFQGNHPKVEKYYGRSVERFLSEIWWPDIVRSHKKFGVIYTAAFIPTYNGKVNGNFEEGPFISERDLLQYGRELLKYGGEIGFHGYNHQSLVYEKKVSMVFGYRPWPSLEMAGEALQVARDYFHEIYPNYNWHTYVAASNIFDMKSKEIIDVVLPEIEIYAGVLNSDNPASLVQEYSVKDNITQLPRVSSGSRVGLNDRIIVFSVAATNGIINHFIHPDDFMNKIRGGDMSWEELYAAYEDFLKHINKSYPWIEKMTAYEAGQKVKQYYYGDVYTKWVGDKYYIAYDNYLNEQSLIVNTTSPIVAYEGCVVKELEKNKYLVKMNKNIIFLEVQ